MLGLPRALVEAGYILGSILIVLAALASASTLNLLVRLTKEKQPMK